MIINSRLQLRLSALLLGTALLAILTTANTWPSVILYEDKDGEWIIVERGWPFRFQTHRQELPFGTAQEAFAKGWPSGFDVPLITNAAKLAANSLTAIGIVFGTLMATQFLSRQIARRMHHLRSVPLVQSLPVLGLRWQVLPTTLISAIALLGIAIGAIHLLSRGTKRLNMVAAGKFQRPISKTAGEN